MGFPVDMEHNSQEDKITGCDIHLFVEAYDADTDTWFLTNEYVSGDNRDYALFTKLAGVRGIGPAPKGFPDNVSQGTQYHSDRYATDGHSHSWETLEDFVKMQFDLNYELIFIATLKMRVGYLNPEEEATLRHFDFGPNYIIDWIEYTHLPLSSYRVCFFFDN